VAVSASNASYGSVHTTAGSVVEELEAAGGLPARVGSVIAELPTSGTRSGDQSGPRATAPPPPPQPLPHTNPRPGKLGSPPPPMHNATR